MSRDPQPDPGRLDDRDHDADRRFIDALLHHHFHGSEDAASARLDAVLGRIDHPEEPPVRIAPARRPLRLLRPLAAAAVLFGLLLIPFFLSNTAAAAIDRTAIAMARPVDLHYRIEITTPIGRAVPGEIWFRGADLVALRLDGPAGEVWAGEGRDVAWVVPALSGLAVRVNERGTLLEALRIQEGATIPFLRVTDLLTSLGDGYELEFGADGETIEARRVAGSDGDLPITISVKVAPDGVIRELEAEWKPLFGPRRARLTCGSTISRCPHRSRSGVCRTRSGMKKSHISPACLSIALLLTAQARAAAQDCHDLDAVTVAAQNLLLQSPASGSSCVSIEQSGVNIYEQSFGSATATQVFTIASATKTLSAAVLMSLVDEGQLGLDDKASEQEKLANLVRFREFFDIDELKEANELRIAWHPDGTLSTVVNGKRKPDLEAPDLAASLFDVYLGADPVSKSGKKKLIKRLPEILAALPADAGR